MNTPTTIAALKRCTDQCRAHQDRRGDLASERACATRLGGSAIDRDAAAAARRVGVWLREWRAPTA